MAAFYDPDAAPPVTRRGSARRSRSNGGNIDARFAHRSSHRHGHTPERRQFHDRRADAARRRRAMGPTATFKIGGVEVVIN